MNTRLGTMDYCATDVKQPLLSLQIGILHAAYRSVEVMPPRSLQRIAGKKPCDAGQIVSV